MPGLLSQAADAVTSVVPVAGLAGPGFDVQPVRAMLRQIDGPPLVVQFDFNPASVGLRRNAKPHDKMNEKSTEWETSVQIVGNLVVTLTDVRFVGPTTKAKVEQLMSWAAGSPTPAMAAGIGLGAAVQRAVGGALGVGNTTKASGTSSATPQNQVRLPRLIFTWGEAMQYTAILLRLDVSYTRFAADGTPLQAKAALDLECYDTQPDGTNPTSGGLPGRARHTVVTGDSIVGLATETYGSPRAWRAVAEANGLDDPLRLAPGQQLYLPSPEELHAGQGA